jgi:CheY-like chemotaxis protein
MRGDARLNLLLTPPPAPAYERGEVGQPWHRTLSQLLCPMGVRTFEANSGQEAMDLLEHTPIHLAVVDTRLPAIGGLNVLQLIQRLREHGQRHFLPAPPPTTDAMHLHMRVEEHSTDGLTRRHIEVRVETRILQQVGPVVILIAPPPAQQDAQLLREALKFNAFSVLNEPVDVNLALEVMARAMKRWFSGQWPVMGMSDEK